MNHSRIYYDKLGQAVPAPHFAGQHRVIDQKAISRIWESPAGYGDGKSEQGPRVLELRSGECVHIPEIPHGLSRWPSLDYGITVVYDNEGKPIRGEVPRAAFPYQRRFAPPTSHKRANRPTLAR